MKKVMLLAMLLLAAAGSSAKKVKLTIDGTTYATQTKLYLIVNEDTANAQLIPIENGRFSVTISVEKDAFIRLHDYKEFAERSPFVLIPDSKHITLRWGSGEITGSEKSSELKNAMDAIRREDPGSFHIDVFSDNPEDWERARLKGESIRRQMEIRQREIILQQIMENSDNNIPAWIYFCYRNQIDMPAESFALGKKARWVSHKIIKLLKEREAGR